MVMKRICFTDYNKTMG